MLAAFVANQQFSSVFQNIPPDLSQCVCVIEQALSVRALQELVTAAGSETVSCPLGTPNFENCFFWGRSPRALELIWTIVSSNLYIGVNQEDFTYFRGTKLYYNYSVSVINIAGSQSEI